MSQSPGGYRSRRERVLRMTVAAAVMATFGGCGAEADAELASGARVRFQAPGYGQGWLVGVVGEAGDCTSIMVPDPGDAPRRFAVVPVDSVTRLQVSVRDHAQAAAATIGAGEWREVEIRSVHGRYGGCSPMETMP